MNSNSLIHLTLNALGCSQKDLAQRLKVSAAQISKWKKGEYMSFDMLAKLSELAGIGDKDPDFVLQSGSIEDAEKWMRLLHFIADLATESAETGYHTYLLEESEEETMLCWKTFQTLQEMGIVIPQPFPTALDFDYKEDSVESEKRAEKIFSNPYASLIFEIYKSYTDIYGFYAAYVAEIIEKLELHETPTCDIEPELLSLAASKLEDIPDFAKDFKKFKWRTNKNYIEWLMFLKEQAFLAGMPLRAELLDMVHSSHDSLGHAAEAESLGFNDSRLHPDIYMNELLVGMRIIHQVLPAIMKKLGIDEEFKLDQSDLRLN